MEEKEKEKIVCGREDLIGWRSNTTRRRDQERAWTPRVRLLMPLPSESSETRSTHKKVADTSLLEQRRRLAKLGEQRQRNARPSTRFHSDCSQPLKHFSLTMAGDRLQLQYQRSVVLRGRTDMGGSGRLGQGRRVERRGRDAGCGGGPRK